MMFLRCLPSVFVINDEYEILIFANQNGLIGIRIDGQIFYEENTGALYTEKDFAKIRVPQKLLDDAKSYQVVYRKAIERCPYFSHLEDEICCEFKFKPLEKTENINIYHVADVHYEFEKAVNACSYFGDKLDFLIVNGDIGEVNSEQEYFMVAKFVGDVAKGELPVLFVRGNHDVRGRLAERYTDYFPANGKDTFFTFSVGNLNGVALDCGEDKLDSHSEYGGVNDFKRFRERETKFLKNVRFDDTDKITFGVCHITPIQVTLLPDSCYDIERETYTVWNDILEKIGVKFFISAHRHIAYALLKGDPKNLIDHEYPVIVGSVFDKNKAIVAGCAMVLSKNHLNAKITDNNLQVLDEFDFDI
jgi:predicted MPP superfamily phosphohydrolase